MQIDPSLNAAPIRWQVGEFTITRLLELPPMAFDPAMFLETTREELLRHRDWLVPRFATAEGDIILHFQAFIIEAHGKLILVDPCIGNNKPRSYPLLDHLDNDFLDRLAAAGFPRERIDYVLCTHLHVDHCGWNTMRVDGEWVPTFPNARYLFAQSEVDYLKVDKSEPDAQAIYLDSVKPILDAGLADFVKPGHVVVDGIHLRATPGHTPGHCSVMVESQGQQAIITGDVVHHPIQIARPDVSSNFCWDESIATATRREVLTHAANTHALVVAAHFAGPTAVRVRPDGDAWRLDEPCA